MSVLSGSDWVIAFVCVCVRERERERERQREIEFEYVCNSRGCSSRFTHCKKRTRQKRITRVSREPSEAINGVFDSDISLCDCVKCYG